MALFVCQRCGSEFSAGSARAKWCSDLCRKRQQQRPVEPGSVSAADGPSAVGAAEAAFTAELAAVDRLGSAAGQTVLALARVLDAAGETGSAKASAARQLESAMERALAGVRVADDPLDELALRRANRTG